MPAAPWVQHEVGHAQLGDTRRVRRLTRVVSDLAAHPGDSIPAACGDWAATKAAYRFFDDDGVAAGAIRDAHQAATLSRIAAHATVLVLQDTTALDFSTHPGLAGAGPLARTHGYGVWLHSALAASDAGVPLGLVDQQQWARDPATTGKRHTRRQRPTAEKESQRWLDALTATQALLTTPRHVVTVADREADIYDLFAAPRPATSDLLVRAAHNRRVGHEARYLNAAVAAAPVAGLLPIALQRADGQPPREATLAVRFRPLALQPPRHHPQRATRVPIPVVAILAEELAPPPGQPPIRWLLLTTWRVMELEEAVTCVRWYAARWVVERFHYVLKQGCKVEDLQLRTTDRLERAVAVFTIVAWRLLWLTYLAREEPEAPCTVALADPVWQALWCSIHHRPDPPTTPPSLHLAVRWIAQLGGFLGRAGDGEPGAKVLWRGLRRLDDITLGWTVARVPPPGPAPPSPLPLHPRPQDLGNG